MRRFLGRSCLLAVLAVPLLDQAEAAEALARSLAELTERGVIEPDDPGSGGPGLESPRAEIERGPGCLRAIPPALDAHSPQPAPTPATLLAGSHLLTGCHPDLSGPPRHSHRRAILQVFLF